MTDVDVPGYASSQERMGQITIQFLGSELCFGLDMVVDINEDTIPKWWSKNEVGEGSTQLHGLRKKEYHSSTIYDSGFSRERRAVEENLRLGINLGKPVLYPFKNLNLSITFSDSPPTEE